MAHVEILQCGAFWEVLENDKNYQNRMLWRMSIHCVQKRTDVKLLGMFKTNSTHRKQKNRIA